MDQNHGQWGIGARGKPGGGIPSLYADGWSRYWRAFDNGREVPVLIGNYAFKAVRLGPGEHTVRFLYDPAHYKAGLVAFYGGLLSAILLLVAAARRTRRSAHQPAGGS